MSDTPADECLSPQEILARPNLSIDRQVMAMAFLFPAADRRKRGKPSPLCKACFVNRHSRALAEDVLAGRIKLDEAFQIAEKAWQDSNSIYNDAGHTPLAVLPDREDCQPVASRDWGYCRPAALRRPTPREISAMTDALDRFLNDERIDQGQEHQSPHYEFLYAPNVERHMQDCIDGKPIDVELMWEVLDCLDQFHQEASAALQHCAPEMQAMRVLGIAA